MSEDTPLPKILRQLEGPGYKDHLLPINGTDIRTHYSSTLGSEVVLHPGTV